MMVKWTGVMMLGWFGDSDNHSGVLRSDRLWCLHILHCDLEFFRMRNPYEDVVDMFVGCWDSFEVEGTWR